ncbi:MAG: hypothetical protein CR981_03030 [Proteobacteria bacterium]|nr:MAG: hypothetical protein CR981_03030 [Pseudomonadota bacterium]
MKKVLLAAAITLAATNVQAADKSTMGGLFFGASSGALMGQAIGGDTESTLVGTAIGSMLGLIIGSEMEKPHRIHHHRHMHRPHIEHQPEIYQEEHISESTYYYEEVEQVPVHYRPIRRKCKEAEILGTINGKPRKLYGIVCKTRNGWELVSDTYEFSSSEGPDYNRWHDDHFVPGHYRYKEDHGQNWVHHRF